jgi:hypothetical protein
VKLRDKESNLDLHVQSVASSLLDDPGSTLPSTTAHGGRRRGRKPSPATLLGLCHARRWRTIFSKPLAHPSTLDRRFRRPTWRSFGARRSCAGWKFAGKSRSHLQLRFSMPQHRGTFLSRAGPHCRFSACSSWASPWFGWSSVAENDEGDHVGRPRLDRYAARKLACIPPSEGRDEAGQARLVETAPARPDRCGCRRFGEVRSGVDGDQHGSRTVAESEHSRANGNAQGFQT